MKKRLEQLLQTLHLQKKSAVIVALGLVGIVLLVLSELLPAAGAKKEQQPNTPESTTLSAYEKDVEQRLGDLLSQIEGAGQVKVMVTLECSDENVYALQEKSQNTQSGTSYESTYQIVKSGGEEGGMLLRVTQPRIRGVAVVCSGGHSAVVQQSILQTVTAVTGASAAQISVTAMQSTNGG